MATTSTSSSFTSAAVAELRADGLAHAYRDRRILTDISLTVPPGARVGLIGENGSGKSTLLRLLAGVEHADAGRVRRPERTGLLWQEPPFASTATIAEVLDDALADARSLERELEAAAARLAEVGDPDGPEAVAAARAYDDALDAAIRADVWAATARRDTTVAGLGLGSVDRSRRVIELSGGQRARLSLACLLVRRPTALLLDEPTNHLDDAAIGFVLETLAQWPGPVLVASHDRAFLDDAATAIVDLDPVPHEGDGAAAVLDADVDGDPGDPGDPDGGDRAGTRVVSGRNLTAFGGTFSDYLGERERMRERWRSRHERERAELERLEHLAERAHDHGRTSHRRAETRIARKFFGDRTATVISRRVHAAERQADELARVAVGAPPERLRFTPPRGAGADGRLAGRRGDVTAGAAEPDAPGDRPEPEPGPVVAAVDARVAGRLAPVNVTVARGEALMVTGPNGAGKSTLLHVLAGRVDITGGELEVAPDARIGLLAQDVTFEHPERSASRIYRDAVGYELAEAVPLDGMGLFTRADARRPVGELSVGQRRRVALAIVLADPPDLLLLDEPTNHLSLALATELEQAMAEFEGALVVATHDRWARRRWEGKRLELAAVR